GVAGEERVGRRSQAKISSDWAASPACRDAPTGRLYVVAETERRYAIRQQMYLGDRGRQRDRPGGVSRVRPRRGGRGGGGRQSRRSRGHRTRGEKKRQESSGPPR